MQIFNAVVCPSLGRLGGKVDKLRGWWGGKVAATSGTRQGRPQPSAPTRWRATAGRVHAHKDRSGNNPPRAFPIDRRAKSSGLHLSPDGRRCVVVEGVGRGGEGGEGMSSWANLSVIKGPFLDLQSSGAFLISTPNRKKKKINVVSYL